MHRHRDVLLAAEPLGKADVVGVPWVRSRARTSATDRPIAASSRGMSR
jgi:hypothetical protein